MVKKEKLSFVLHKFPKIEVEQNLANRASRFIQECFLIVRLFQFFFCT